MRYCRGVSFFVFFSLSFFVCFVPSAAAHLAVRDSALFSGMLQPWLHGQGILLVLAAGLGAGTGLAGCPADAQVRRLRQVAILFIAGMCAGVLLRADESRLLSGVVCGTTLAIALRVCAAARTSWPAACFVAALAGFLTSVHSLAGMDLPARYMFFFFAGAAVCSWAIFSGLVFVCASFGHPGFRIAVRVAASWIAAVSAMMLAYLFKDGFV